MLNAVNFVKDLNSCRHVHFPTTITITPRDMVIIVDMETVTWVQILDEAVCV